MLNGEAREDAPRSSGMKSVIAGSQVLIGNARLEGVASETRQLPRGSTQILGAAGFLLIAVSWSHLVTTFFPYRFGIAAWEYAAVTQSIDVMPISVVGLALAAAASLAHGWRRRGMLLIVLAAVMVVALAGMIGLVVLDLPIAWKAVPASMHRDLIKSSTKAVVFAIAFGWFQIWVARHLWRARRSGAA
jgi:hypothetical protein